ncbi:MAG TPA: DnaT-like ssDNA-binding domain-containing protein [Pseudomonadales bacterium]
MADDWIKIRTDLSDDPNVLAMAEVLSMECPTVVGLLVTFWGWMDKHTSDGALRNLSDALIDRKLSTPGFSDALRKVGWLEGSKDDLRLPKFERHNGASAKARSLESEAKRLRRKAAAEDLLREQNLVGQTSDTRPTKKTRKVRPEKRREEKRTEESSKSIIDIDSAPAGDRMYLNVQMTSGWTPSIETAAVLEGKGVPSAFWNTFVLSEFRLYWSERGDSRSPRAWQTTFRKHVEAKYREAGHQLLDDED